MGFSASLCMRPSWLLVLLGRCCLLIRGGWDQHRGTSTVHQQKHPVCSRNDFSCIRPSNRIWFLACCCRGRNCSRGVDRRLGRRTIFSVVVVIRGCWDQYRDTRTYQLQHPACSSEGFPCIRSSNRSKVRDSPFRRRNCSRVVERRLGRRTILDSVGVVVVEMVGVGSSNGCASE